MFLEREARTAPFSCTHARMTHAAGAVRNLVRTNGMLVHVCVVVGAICKSSARDEMLKMKVHFVPALRRTD